MTTARAGQITVTTAGTAVAGPDIPGRKFALAANPGNTGVVYVGSDEAAAPDTTAATAYALDKTTMNTLYITVSNLKILRFDCATNGDKVCWIRVD